MSESTPYQRGHAHSPSYNSAEGGGISTTISGGLTSPPHSPNLSRTYAGGRTESPARFESSRMGSGSGQGGDGDLISSRIIKVIVARFVKSAKRGNLPFMVVFVRWVFWSSGVISLTGKIYHLTLHHLVISLVPLRSIKRPFIPLYHIPSDDHR